MSNGEESELIWKSDGGSVEIRTLGQLEDGQPALDEVVATGAAIHLEQMAHDSWWIGVEAGRKALPSLVHTGRRALVCSAH